MVLGPVLSLGGFASAEPPVDSLALAHVQRLADGTCVSNFNFGGVMGNYLDAAKQANKGACKLVRIENDCVSGCTLFVDQLRIPVCVLPNAKFGFHLGRSTQKLPVFTLAGYKKEVPPDRQYIEYLPAYSGVFKPWVDAHTLFLEVKIMSYPYMVKLFPLCQG